MKVNDSRLEEICSAMVTDSMYDYEKVFESIKHGEIYAMAKECLSRRKAESGEQSLGVWNPLEKEIAVNHKSGIKLVDIAHWHSHCTMEVIVREMSDHPAVKARKEAS